jgi:hypothetical protein
MVFWLWHCGLVGRFWRSMPHPSSGLKCAEWESVGLCRQVRRKVLTVPAGLDWAPIPHPFHGSEWPPCLQHAYSYLAWFLNLDTSIVKMEAMSVWNVSLHLEDYMMSQSRSPLSHSLTWKPQNCYLFNIPDLKY